MSAEAHAAIAKAEADGMVFDDPVPTVKPKTERKPTVSVTRAPRKSPATNDGTTNVAALAEPTGHTFRVTLPGATKSKPVNERTACSKCRASLSYCHCLVPTVGLLILDPAATQENASEIFVDIQRGN